MTARNIRQAIAACRAFYLAKGGRESTWEGDYAKILKHLDETRPLTKHRLTDLIQRWEPNTRSRQRACCAAKYLAKHAGLDWDPGELRGHYHAEPVDPSKIPEDPEIESQFHLLRNPSWRWVYGCIATYGLRPHEALRADTTRCASGDHKFWVPKNTKTGPRRVWPIPPEWYYDFGISHPRLPNVSLDRTNEALGHSASEYFGDTAKLPFNLYSLRHAWARRAYLEGLDDAAAAKMMGHSLQIHQTIYRAWFDDLVSEAAYQRMLKNRKPRNV
jgi:integrase